MFSREMQRIYKRLMILGMLSMCLFYFGYSDKVEKVFAAPCIQDCEASEAMCYDSCKTSCSADSTDQECSDCITSCRNSFTSCMRHAIYCEPIDTGPAGANCSLNFGGHCPIVGGTANCNDPSAHNGFFLICPVAGGQQCISCPDHEYCVGANGLPPCF